MSSLEVLALPGVPVKTGAITYRVPSCVNAKEKGTNTMSPKSGVETGKIRRHELWRKEYRNRRYLEDKSEAFIYARRDYLLDNVTTLTNNGQIGFLPSPLLWECQTHLLEELSMRGLQLPNSQFIPPSLPVAEYLKKHKVPQWESTPGELFRFSKKKYLEPLLSDGILYLAPASSYKQDDLVDAMKDDELSLNVVAQPGEVAVNLFIKGTGRKVGWTNPDVRTVNFPAEQDFYLCCMANVYAPRLWFDFWGSDTCLVVRDSQVFLERLRAATDAQLPDWNLLATDAVYIDPFVGTKDGPPRVETAKDIRYAYQQEFRLIWTTSRRLQDLAPTSLDLGPLHDCCELLHLRDIDTNH